MAIPPAAGSAAHDPCRQYDRLLRGAVLCRLDGRTHLELTGKDRAGLLHNLCTNDIKRLAPGSGCEAFFTTVQGKTIGYVYCFCGPDAIWLESAPGQAETLGGNLQRYQIREEVRIADRSGTWCELLLAGAEAEACLRQSLGVVVPEAMFANLPVERPGRHGWVGRVPFVHPRAFFLACPVADVDDWSADLQAGGAEPIPLELVETARIEAGTPLFGVDITAANFPQEVDRNDRAISFRKGCYLGQETVARIDSLGHVNRRLVGLVFAGQRIPPPGTRLPAGDRPVAAVTSSTWSCRLAAPLALAYVRRGHDQAGQRWATDFGEARVVQLPLE